MNKNINLKKVFNNIISRLINPDKADLNRLISDLDDAKKLLSEFSGGYSNNFLSAEEFYEAYSIELKK